MTADEVHAILRTDFASFIHRVFLEVDQGTRFIPAWHLDAIYFAAAEIGLKRRRRQIIEVTPRSLKSICTSVALVAWLLGHDPTRKLICVSYSQELASRFSAQCRQVMKSSWYRRLFPGTIISSEKDTERYFRTTAGGYRDATSVGGTLTGIGADLIIIDDPAKPDEMMSEAHRNSVNEWFDRTLLSRLNNKLRDGILIVMQRLHPNDLAGHVKARGGWDVLTLPAIAPADESAIQLGPERYYQRAPGEVLSPQREPRIVLDEIKLGMGSRAFSAQYQQNPVPEDGGIIDWRWFRNYDALPPRRNAKIVQSWDCASKNTEFSDFSVCSTWMVVGINYYLLDIFRQKLTFPELFRAVVQQSEKWGAQVILIEDAAAGISLIQFLRLQRPNRMPVPLAIKPEKDKLTRVHAVSHVVEQGRVHIPLIAPWLDDFRNELLQFPDSKHDDQVDRRCQSKCTRW